MRLKNILIVVADPDVSKRFYHDLFGLEPVADSGEVVILTEGLVLQERAAWQRVLGKEVIPESHSCELYFEERDLEAFVRKLERLDVPVRYVSRMTEPGAEQSFVRFYDPDGTLIEVGTPERQETP